MYRWCQQRFRTTSLGPGGHLAMPLLWVCLLITPSVMANTVPSVDAINRQLEEISARGDLGEDLKTSLVSQLEASAAALQRAASLNASTADNKSETDSTQQTVGRLQNQLAQAQANPPDTASLVNEGAPPQQIDSQISLLEAKREALAGRRGQLLREMEDWPGRRNAIQQRLVALQGEIDDNLRATLAPGDTLERKVAKQLAQAKGLAMLAEQHNLQQEMLGKPARLEVSSAERDWVGQALAHVDLKLAALSEAAESARARATQEKLQTAAALKEELSDLSPGIKEYADRNQTLALQLQQFSVELEVARANT